MVTPISVPGIPILIHSDSQFTNILLFHRRRKLQLVDMYKFPNNSATSSISPSFFRPSPLTHAGGCPPTVVLEPTLSPLASYWPTDAGISMLPRSGFGRQRRGANDAEAQLAPAACGDMSLLYCAAGRPVFYWWVPTWWVIARFGVSNYFFFMFIQIFSICILFVCRKKETVGAK